MYMKYRQKGGINHENESEHKKLFMDGNQSFSCFHAVDAPDHACRRAGSRTERNRGWLCDFQPVVPWPDRSPHDPVACVLRHLEQFNW